METVYYFVRILLLIALFYIYSRYRLRYWTRRNVQQLHNPHWFFGNFKDAIVFRSGPGWYLKKLYEQSKDNVPFFGFYIFQRPCIGLKDPDVINQILEKDFANFPDRNFGGNREKDSVGMRNLFGIRSVHWKNLRRKISPAFSEAKVKAMLSLIMENGKTMTEYINQLRADENGIKYIDGYDLNCKFATDVISNIGLGIPLDSFNNPDKEFSKCTQRFFHSNRRFAAMASVFFLQPIVDLIGPLIYLDILSYYKKNFWEVIESREKTDTVRGDYIDTILKLKNGRQDLHYKLEGDNLLYQTGHFFSGIETSSTASAFTLMELGKNKELQSRAREDIQKNIAKYGWTYEAFKKMQYLEQCIMEGLRLYPPVPFLDRQAKEDYMIPGTDVVIERGTAVYVAIGAIHRDPQHFSNPDVFDPDRFKSGSPKIKAFMPFGMGPKGCIGTRLGLLHVKVVLSLLLIDNEVTFKPKNERLLDPRSTFTTVNKGLHMELIKLNTSNV